MSAIETVRNGVQYSKILEFRQRRLKRQAETIIDSREKQLLKMYKDTGKYSISGLAQLKIMENDPQIKNILSQAYILGGSPCSGKSTIAEKLSSRYHLQYYKVDDHYQDHVARCDPERHPTISKISRLGWNEIWSRPVSDQVQEEIEYYRELFEMILQDLGKYEIEKPIIVEGAALLPELIERSKLDPRRVLFMVSTKEFQIHHYSQRAFIHQILKDCEDPEEAFKNWMERDYLFGQEILKQAENLGAGTIIVDDKRGVEAQFDAVSQYFGLS